MRANVRERRGRRCFFSDLYDFSLAANNEKSMGYHGSDRMPRYQRKTERKATLIAEKYSHVQEAQIAEMSEKCSQDMQKQFRMVAKATFITGFAMAASAFVASAFSEPLGIATLALGLAGMVIVTPALLYAGDKAAKCVPAVAEAAALFRSALLRAKQPKD